MCASRICLFLLNVSKEYVLNFIALKREGLIDHSKFVSQDTGDDRSPEQGDTGLRDVEPCSDRSNLSHVGDHSTTTKLSRLSSQSWAACFLVFFTATANSLEVALPVGLK